jgi:hypothetical protein
VSGGKYWQIPGDKWILNERGEPIPENDLLTWATWIEHSRRHVDWTYIGRSWVSTIFMGLDHSFVRGVPILWETMVFGGALDQEQTRCGGSREQAMAMHSEMCARVTEAERFWVPIFAFLDEQIYDFMEWRDYWRYNVRRWHFTRAKRAFKKLHRAWTSSSTTATSIV